MVRQERLGMALDVGCGTNSFNPERRLVVGIDIDKNSLLKLKRKKWDGIPVVADAAQLPFTDSSFDRVNCSHILEHVKDDDQTMGEISRVTKHRGQLELKVPHPIFDTMMAGSLLGYFRYWSEKNHVRVFSPRKIVNLVKKNGFDVTSVNLKGWWRAVTTVGNYVYARINNEPIDGHSSRIKSQRQARLLRHRERYLKMAGVLDEKVPFMNNIFPYETQVIAKKL